MKNKFHLFILLLSSSLFAQKEETTLTADLKEVTVYSASAELKYEKEVSLKKGKNILVFQELTPFIVENSVNVSVADKSADILTVNERINYTREKRHDNTHLNALKDSIKILKREAGLTACRREVVEREKDLLFKGDAIGGLSTKAVPVAEIEKASLFFNKRYYELNKELFLLKEKEEQLDEIARKLENQVKDEVAVTYVTASDIKVTLHSASAQTTKITFRFLSTTGSWTPVYDFKFSGPSNPLQFTFRANVKNASGHSWNDVQIKLSTADPTHSFSLPGTNSNTKTYVQQGVKFREVEVVNTITEFTVAHEYTIPSDGKAYAVDVMSYSMPASYNYLLIPRLDPFGFLMARIPAWNKYNLLSGQANIYNMGTYMGKTYINAFTENDTLSLYLGKDRSIQASREEKTKKHENNFVGNYQVEETNTKISVRNNFSEALPVVMIDAVPVIDEDEKLNVYDIAAAQYNKEEGKLEWKFTIKPGETMEFSYGYEWKSPKSVKGHYKPKHKKFRTISCPTF
jgi:hypothetical protein